MHISVSPELATITGQHPVSFAVSITNSSSVIIGCSVRVLGADPSWVSISDAEPRLFPDQTSTVIVDITVPAQLPAGNRTMSIQVLDVADPTALAIHEVKLEVPEDPRLTLTIDPPYITAGKRAQFATIVANTGNSRQRVTMSATDPKAKTQFDFQPRTFSLEPGASMPVALRTKARRKLFGDATLRPFQVDVATTPEPATPTPPASAVFIQKSIFSRGLLALVGLLLAVSIFALVIVIALSSVVNRSAADRNLALAVAQAKNAPVTTGQSALSGSVTDLMTGSSVPGMSVAVLPQDDVTTPLATSATDEAGKFSFQGLPAGAYLLQVQGGGYGTVWYPAAQSAGDAQAVTVEEGKSVDNLAVLVGGVPASLSGEVTGADVSGATLTLQIPLDTGILAGSDLNKQPKPNDGAGSSIPVGAIVSTVPIASDGKFKVENLPSPAIYDLIVTKDGLAPTVQRVDVAAGENREKIILPLLSGDGIIEGTVVGGNGPIGEASIVATAPNVTVRTVSLTQGNVGGFVLRGLPTPGTYTITVSADGFSTATMSLTLTAGQQLTGVSAILGSATGSLGGLVTVESGSAAGIDVTVTDGATTLHTVTQSTAPVGRWNITGLRVPSTYTITFSGAGMTSQVVSVRVDGFGNVTQGATNAQSVNARLTSAMATLEGVVKQSGSGTSATPIGNVTVTLSSGDTQRVVSSASTPARDRGRYQITDLRPGTYTVTFSTPGTTPTSTIVSVSAGQTKVFNPVLVAPASITGKVTVALTNAPAAGLTVNLYLASEYGTAAGPRASTVTDGQGRYAFTEVDAPEHYIVEVRTAVGGSIVATSRPISLDASDAFVFNAKI